MWIVLVALLAQSADFQADGIKALDAQKYDEAVELFTKAVAADPKDYGAHFHLALAYSLLGKDANAIPEYKTVLELKPGLYEAELNLGISLLRSKDASAAIPYLKSAVEQKSKEFRPAFYLAQALFEKSEFAEAAAAYTNAISLNAGSAAARTRPRCGRNSGAGGSGGEVTYLSQSGCAGPGLCKEQAAGQSRAAGCSGHPR